MSRLLLGIDASTQSVSCLLFAVDRSEVVAESSVNFGEDLPRYEAPQGFIPDGADGEVHADPRMWLEGLDLALDRLREAGGKLEEVVAISGAGQQHGTVYLNAEGLARLGQLDTQQPLADQFTGGFARPTSPIWMDTSTTEQCRAIEAAVGGAEVVCAKSGSIAIERFSGPQIRRFAETDPDGYAACRRIHLVSSFLASVLAGVDAPIDHGDGAGMNLLNLEALDWDEDLLKATAAGLRERLPAAVPSATLIGPVAPYFVERHGMAPGARVVAFTGDNPSSLVGMGAWNPGKLVISLGTSDTFFAAMPEPLTDPNGCGHVFGNPQGGFMTLQCFLNGSLAREQVRDALGMDWDGFTRAIEASEPGCGKARLLPFFDPEISPRLSQGQVIWTGDGDWTNQPRAARACVEGQFLNMRICTDWMELQPKEVYLTGGASRNPAICQIVADVFGATVRRLHLTGSVAMGAALRAGMGSGEIDEATAHAWVEQSVDNKALKPRREFSRRYANALDSVRRLPAYAGRHS